MCFIVRPYIRPPLRCYKCQQYGHLAADAEDSKGVLGVGITIGMRNMGTMRKINVVTVGRAQGDMCGM